VFGFLAANLSHGPSSTLKSVVLAATPSPSFTPSPTPTASPSPTPSPSPSTVPSDFSSALPSWLLVTLVGLVAFIVLAMFALTAYNLSAPRAPLKRLLNKTDPQDAVLIRTLATNAQVGTRTTRTILAIAGFSLLGVAVIAVFGLSGQGVRDLRSQIVASITTLVAAIAGFYFGTRAAEGAAGGGSANESAAAPTVTGVSPASGQSAGGDTVTVTGTGFTGATRVNFGPDPATNLNIAGDTTLTVTSPPGTAGTPVDVTVTTPAGTSATTPADQFTHT
jgi:IPT/TIG domain